MSNVECKADGTVATIFLKGHIDSVNTGDVENDINAFLDANPCESIILDCRGLEYISSAGLRVILRLKKRYDDLKLVEVSNDVYQVFEMTGFTELIEVHKAFRVLSIDGCEVIGEGANGKVYRIDRDTIVKVYVNPDALPEIERERELARTAFVLGVPTAIPYDVVRVGEGYGSVFELLDAKSFAQLLIRNEKPLEEVAGMSVDLLKTIHGTEVNSSAMPDMRTVAIGWAEFMADHLPKEQYEKLLALITAVPEDHHMMHGDYHIKNVMLQNGEVLLIDMDTLCYGHPIFEFASMYNAYQGFSELDHENVHQFLGIDWDRARAFWRKSLELYLGTDDEERIQEVEDKARVVGYTRIMRRCIRRNGYDTAEGRAAIENCKRQLAELLPRIDTLLF